MTVQHLVRAIDADLRLLNASDRAVFLELAYRADKYGTIRHTQTEIADAVKLSRRRVADVYGVLEGTHVIERAAHGRYRLNLKEWEQLDTLL